MNIDEILKEANRGELDIASAVMMLINLQSINNVYLQAVLKKQLELQQELKGNPGADVTDKMEEITKGLDSLAEEQFYKLWQEVIK